MLFSLDFLCCSGFRASAESAADRRQAEHDRPSCPSIRPGEGQGGEEEEAAGRVAVGLAANRRRRRTWIDVPLRSSFSSVGGRSADGFLPPVSFDCRRHDRRTRRPPARSPRRPHRIARPKASAHEKCESPNRFCGQKAVDLPRRVEFRRGKKRTKRVTTCNQRFPVVHPLPSGSKRASGEVLSSAPSKGTKRRRVGVRDDNVRLGVLIT